MIRAVSFDATGTLFCSPRLGAIYAEVLERHGIGVEAATAERLVREVWTEFACASDPSRDRFAGEPEAAPRRRRSSRGFWRRFVARLAERLEAPTPSRFAAAELYHRFGTASAWELFPEVPAVLAELSRRGFALAVISNWDERLPGLLADLGIAGSFAAIVVSSAVGVEKPHPRIFGCAAEHLGVRPGEVLHVGDRRLEDLEGAIAAGFSALLVDRRRRPARDADLSDLSDLPALLSTAP